MPKENGKASKTNVSARMGRKEKVEQQPKVIRIADSKVTKSEVTSWPTQRQPQTDEEKAAVNAYNATMKELHRSTHKAAGFEPVLRDNHRRLVALGLRQF